MFCMNAWKGTITIIYTMVGLLYFYWKSDI